MRIISQDKTEIINCNKVEYIGTINGIISAQFNNRRIVLGEYDDENRCKEILQEILDSMHLDEFCMPEE